MDTQHASVLWVLQDTFKAYLTPLQEEGSFTKVEIDGFHLEVKERHWTTNAR